MEQFCEEQRFAWWATACGAAGIAGGMVAVGAARFAEPGEMGMGVFLGLEALFLALGVVVLNLFSMRTIVDRNGAVVTFGRWFPLYRKRIAPGEIAGVRVVAYRPLRDFGGWGIRFGRFEGKRCRALNVRGDRGVLLTLRDGGRLVIGSQTPEALAAALGGERGREDNCQD